MRPSADRRSWHYEAAHVHTRQGIFKGGGPRCVFFFFSCSFLFSFFVSFLANITIGYNDYATTTTQASMRDNPRRQTVAAIGEFFFFFSFFLFFFFSRSFRFRFRFLFRSVSRFRFLANFTAEYNGYASNNGRRSTGDGPRW